MIYKILFIILLIICLIIAASLIIYKTKVKKYLTKEKEELTQIKKDKQIIKQTIEIQQNTVNDLKNEYSVINENINKKKEKEIEVNNICLAKEEELTKLRNKQYDIELETKDLKNSLELINNQIKNKKELSKQIEAQLKEQLEKIEDRYNLKLEELSNNYNSKAENIENQIQDLREKELASIQAAANKYEKEQKIDFYRLQLPKKDLEDVLLLRSIESKLNHKEVLGKIIYKVYFEKPYTDLVNRIVGKEKVTGIYKITNLKNKMCYIGQSVDIRERWKQHIKRALNAETRTKNKLYPAMEEFGVENFSFEIIDRCDKEKLNEREQYFQEFYGAKTFGYSIK